jgi:homoserine dehydrogenase
LLAQVEGSMNAVMVNGDASGVTLYYGAGAGAEETASAVIADLVDIACASACGPRHRVPALGFQSGALTALAVLPMAEVCSRYYLRVDTAPGTEAAQAVLQALRSAGIGLQSHRCLAHASNAQRQAVTVLTQPMADGALRQALVASHNGPIGHTRAIRVAPLD